MEVCNQLNEYINPFMKVYNDFCDSLGTKLIDIADPQGLTKNSPTRGMPLTDIKTAFTIAMAYLAFVFIGTKVMEKRKAFTSLYPLQFAYNIVQIALCSYMCIEAGLQAYRNGYSLLPCENFNYENPPLGNVLWLFYVSKVLDFMDTIFIVLRKKSDQLSFLHVYHHFTIFSFYWWNVNCAYDGDIYLTIILNGAIHTIMYTYYFLALHTKDIWWKSYLTSCQLIQFMCMLTQAAYLVFSGCQKFPRPIVIIYFFYILSLFILFSQFFVQKYMKKATPEKENSKPSKTPAAKYNSLKQ